MVPTEELDAAAGGSRVHKVLLVAVPALVLIGIVAFGLLKSAPDDTEAGKALPSFELPLINSSGTISAAQLRGSPIIINFWASWCAPCREEAPLFESMWKRYADEGVKFVGVNVQDSEIGAREFVDEFGLTYPVAIDLEQTLAKKLDVFGLPQTFFIDAEGKFFATKSGPRVGKRGATVKLGAISAEDLESTIEALLAATD